MFHEVSMNTDTNQMQQIQLDLSSEKDLKTFFASVAALYDDVVQCETAAETERYQRVQLDDVLGEEVFDTAYDKVSELRGLLGALQSGLSSGVMATDQQADQAQALYQDVLLLRDFVVGEYCRGDELVTAPVLKTPRLLQAPTREKPLAQ